MAKIDLAEFLRDNSPDTLTALMKTTRTRLEIIVDRLPVVISATANIRTLQRFIREEMAGTDELTAITVIRETIKKRFKLNADQVNLLVKELNPSANKVTTKQAVNAQEAKPAALFPDLVDIVETKTGTAFLVIDNGKPVITQTWEVDGELVSPPDRDQMQWLLPRASEVLKHIETLDPSRLYYSLVDYYRQAAELPTESHYHLLAAYTFLTYIQDYLRYIPTLAFIAVAERGKSRTLKSIIYSSYRGILELSLRDSHLIRYSGEYGCTLALDTMDLWKKAEKEGAEDVLLGRFEQGATVRRIINPDKGPYRDSRYFSVFGPLIIASNVSLNRILETRCLQINTPESTRQFHNDITPEAGLPFREALTAWRYQCLLKGGLD